MGIIWRYLSFNYLISFIISSCAMVIFMVVLESSKLLSLLFEKDVSSVMLLELLVHMGFSFIAALIPSATFFAALYTANKFSSDSSELVALRASGLSLLRIFIPVLTISSMIALLAFILNTRALPYSKNQFRKTKFVLASTGIMSKIRQGNFFTEVPNAVMFSGKVDNKKKSFEDIFVHLRDKKGGGRVIFAKKGLLSKWDENKWGMGRMDLILNKGSIIIYKQDFLQIDKILFENYRFPLNLGKVSTSFYNSDSTKSLNQLYRQVFIEKPKKLDKKETYLFKKTEIEFYTRFNNILICIAFVILGFSLGVQGMRGKSKPGIKTGLTFITAYYAIFFTARHLAKYEYISVPLAVFVPGILLLFVGIRYFKRLEWNG